MQVVISNEQRVALKNELVHVLNTYRDTLLKEVSKEHVSAYPGALQIEGACPASGVIESLLRKLSTGEKLLGSVSLSLEPSEVHLISDFVGGDEETIRKRLKQEFCQTFY